MNQPSHSPHHAAHSRRNRRHTLCWVLGFTALLCVAAGGISFALARQPELPSVSTAPELPSASTAPELPSASTTPEAPAQSVPEQSDPFTAAEAQAMLADPRMVLVNHSSKMPDDYTFTTKECGSATAINKTLQTEAADAFLAMQAAAAQDGVTVWMQSGYRSVAYQSDLYDRKTSYYLGKGLSEEEARRQAATIVNPPGYSEHNCGLAADLNCPEYTVLDKGFENTEAFRWLCAHAEEYGFILRYPKESEAVTEITYEPWHWRYVGAENARLLNASGLCFEDAIAAMRALTAALPNE